MTKMLLAALTLSALSLPAYADEASGAPTPQPIPPQQVIPPAQTQPAAKAEAPAADKAEEKPADKDQAAKPGT